MSKDKIYLRPLQENDALISYRWRNDPDIWQYTQRKPSHFITPEIEIEWIRKVISDKTSLRFAIILVDGDKYIGNTQVTNINNGSADYGIFIGEKGLWGRGIASEALKMLIEHVRANTNLSILKLWVHPENKAAQQVYKKNGFIPIDHEINMILNLV